MAGKTLKERVKTRMMQNAAHLWGAENGDIETDCDPLVSMLIEACANEIEKINNEIENTDARVIKYLAQLITPDIITGYRPAHAIMQANPVEQQAVIKPELQFCFTKKLQNDVNPKLQGTEEIFFSPVAEFKLINAAVKYLVFNDTIFENDNAYQKRLIADSYSAQKLTRGCLWIGLEWHSQPEGATELSVYFDLKNNPLKGQFINLLPYTRWSIEGMSLDTVPGLPLLIKNEKSELTNEFGTDRHHMKEVMSGYSSHYITVSNFAVAKIEPGRPQVFKDVFDQSDIEKLSEKCFWIKVEFPNPVTEEMLPDLVCGINCFPVVNKKINELTFRLSQNLNIVPLKSQDHFFAVRGIYSQEGAAYANSPLSNANRLDTGTFIIREGGTERFDKRNAADTVYHMLDLLRDESGAFTALGNEFISSNLKQLNQTLAFIEQRINNTGDSRDSTPYLFVNPFKEGENIFVSFWTTKGEEANNIKSGSKLDLYGSSDVQSDSILLITGTRGGRARMDDMERLAAFKMALLSRDRIVTPQDIRVFCFNELGREIEDVTVKKGFEISNDSKGGFLQTIEVTLKISRRSRSTGGEWKDIADHLGTKIMNNTAGLTPVRLLIEDDQGYPAMVS